MAASARAPWSITALMRVLGLFQSTRCWKRRVFFFKFMKKAQTSLTTALSTSENSMLNNFWVNSEVPCIDPSRATDHPIGSPAVRTDAGPFRMGESPMARTSDGDGASPLSYLRFSPAVSPRIGSIGVGIVRGSDRVLMLPGFCPRRGRRIPGLAWFDSHRGGGIHVRPIIVILLGGLTILKLLI